MFHLFLVAVSVLWAVILWNDGPLYCALWHVGVGLLIHMHYSSTQFAKEAPPRVRSNVLLFTCLWPLGGLMFGLAYLRGLIAGNQTKPPSGS